MPMYEVLPSDLTCKSGDNLIPMRHVIAVIGANPISTSTTDYQHLWYSIEMIGINKQIYP